MFRPALPSPSPSPSSSPSPSPSLSASPFPFPLPPGTDAPPTCEVPQFAPVRVRGGRHRLVRHRRRALAAGLVVTAAALVAAGPHPGAGGQETRRARGHPVADPVGERPATRFVAAPVRIADAATVRLLRPGDLVDVVAAGDGGADDASVVARGVRVTKVPEPVADPAAGGALVVVSVPRATAHRLVGAGTTERLAVTLC
ncbi:hypothetical protein SAMN05428941_3388 [Streptomyces sp. 2114.2]|nr:hypothetical protein BX268_3397 [Streptomyces sp. 2221.1]GHA49265.1 hypothetical protein GCM10010391_37320 [Streptomyces anthocyanicus]SDT54965.1 hypothetical protein SAMN05428941_3388 [Streptomyces sp. 2114.2]